MSSEQFKIKVCNTEYHIAVLEDGQPISAGELEVSDETMHLKVFTDRRELVAVVVCNPGTRASTTVYRNRGGIKSHLTFSMPNECDDGELDPFVLAESAIYAAMLFRNSESDGEELWGSATIHQNSR